MKIQLLIMFDFSLKQNSVEAIDQNNWAKYWILNYLSTL